MARPWPLACASGLAVSLAALADPIAASHVTQLSLPVRRIALAVTALGKSDYMLLCSALLAVLAWGVGHTSRHARLTDRCARLFDGALLFFAAVAASGLVDQFLKHAIGRVRPRASPSGAFTFHPFSLRAAFASFPSGHATTAFAAATVLGLLVPKARWPLFGAATVIAASRVVIDAHYPSDVVGGAGLGIAMSLWLARSPATHTAIGALRSWAGRPWARDAARPRLDPVVATGRFLTRHRAWCLPALITASFAIALPPADLFGSAIAEQAKDCGAVFVALLGLTIRGLVAGFGGEPDPSRDRFKPDGLHSLCRDPVGSGNILVVGGILLMHGAVWTVLLGFSAFTLMQFAIEASETERLERSLGMAYVSSRAGLRRWILNPMRIVDVLSDRPFDAARMAASEYPVVGTTVIALLLAEFYEEIEEPLLQNLLYAESLALGAAAVAAALVVAWLARRRRAGLDLPG